MSDKAITPKQEKFCQKYIETGNASEAYRQSYNTKRMKPETVNREAKKLLDNPKIATLIAELQANLQKKHEVTVERVLKEYARLAFLDIRKAFDEEGNLLPLKEMDEETAAAIAGLEVAEIFNGFVPIGRLKKIKLSDKKGALDSLARHLGMFKDKVEVTGKDGEPVVFTLRIGDGINKDD